MKHLSPLLCLLATVLALESRTFGGTVTNNNDDGTGSLRAEIAAATAGDTIDFGAGLNNQTIALSSGQLVVDKNLTIDASALAGNVTISGNNSSRIFQVTAGSTVRLENLRIIQGKSPDGAPAPLGFAGSPGGSGGAIFNQGILTLADCILQNNRTGNGGHGGGGLGGVMEQGAPGGRGGHGGAIYSTGELTLTDCILRISRSGNGGSGGDGVNGAAGGAGGNGGHGGVIYSTGTLTISGSTVSSSTTGDGGTGAGNLASSSPAGGGGNGGDGGAIYTTGPASISTTTISTNGTGDGGNSGNIEDPDRDRIGGNGGNAAAIYCNANLDLLQCEISNHAPGTEGAGCLTLIGSSHCGEPGSIGGIWINNDGAAAPVCTIENSTITEIEGTVILNMGTLNVTGTTISENDGVGIDNRGTADIETTTVSNNSLSGIQNGLAGGTAVMTITASTISGNDAGSGGSGGGLANGPESSLTLTNSTVANNIARGAVISNVVLGSLRLTPIGGGGGGILNSGSLTLVNSTVTGNEAIGASRTHPVTNVVVTAPGTGGGIFSGSMFSTPTLSLENSLIAGNQDSGTDADIVGSITTEIGVNLLGTSFGLPDPGAFSGIVADPQLAVLGNFGGETETSPPLAGSPAIDAGVNNGLVTDQRGLPRIIDGDNDATATIDIGAVEAQTSLVVSNSDGSGPGSLRETITLVTFPESRITFDPSIFEGEPEDVISLEEELCIPAGLSFSIDASNIAAGVTISGDATVRVFKNSGSVVMTNLLITDGKAPLVAGLIPDPALSCGGGIWNLGELTLNDCTVSSCEAGDGRALFGGGSGTEGASGGGILNTGTLEINRSTVSGNQSSEGGAFGAGAPANVFGPAGTSGIPGIDGSGGGLFTTGMLSITNGTVAENSTSSGGEVGGIHISAGTTELIHATVAGNTSATRAGGIRNEGELILTNSIVANNIGAPGPDLFGAVTSTSGVNLVSDTDGITGGFPGLVTDPLLLPLDDHGGTTESMPPTAGSPVIDAATDPGGLPPLDQLGNVRVSGSAPDIGAVEVVQVATGLLRILDIVLLSPGAPGQLDFDVILQTVTGRWYQLQELDDPENGTYFPLPITNTEAIGPQTTVRVSLPAGERLFRAAEFLSEP